MFLTTFLRLAQLKKKKKRESNNSRVQGMATGWVQKKCGNRKVKFHCKRESKWGTWYGKGGILLRKGG